MNETHLGETTSNSVQGRPRRPSPDITWRLAREALALAVLGDVLLREGPGGINIALWLTAACLTALAFGRRTGAFHQSIEAWPLLLVMAGGLGFVMRDSTLLRLGYVGLVAVGGALLLLQASSGSALRRGVLDLIRAGAGLVRGAAFGVVPIVPVLWAWGHECTGARGRIQAGAKGVLLATPFLLVFASLFASADPMFERLLEGAFSWGTEDLLSHVLFIGILAWIACGSLQRLWLASVEHARSPGWLRSPGAAEVLIAFVAVNLLFLLFLAVQLQSLFGGREFVQATLGLTYAAYARQGFFQLVAAAALATPLLLAGEWATRGATPGHRQAFRRLAMVLLVAVGFVLLSAWSRVHLYQEIYGLTELRLFTQAFMVWIAAVCLWFWRTVLSRRRDRFLAGAVTSALAVLFALSVGNPDAFIVRSNAARLEDPAHARLASEPGFVGFDVHHAGSLSADAVPELLRLLPKLTAWDRCILADRLLTRWSESAAPGWRSWNWSRWRARRAVESSGSALGEAVAACSEPLPWRRSEKTPP